MASRTLVTVVLLVLSESLDSVCHSHGQELAKCSRGVMSERACPSALNLEPPRSVPPVSKTDPVIGPVWHHAAPSDMQWCSCISKAQTRWHGRKHMYVPHPRTRAQHTHTHRNTHDGRPKHAYTRVYAHAPLHTHETPNASPLWEKPGQNSRYSAPQKEQPRTVAQGLQFLKRSALR